MSEKWRAAVAPGAFTSQNVQNTCVLDQFWRFRYRKGVRQNKQIDWYSLSQLINVRQSVSMWISELATYSVSELVN